MKIQNVTDASFRKERMKRFHLKQRKREKTDFLQL